MTAPDAPARSRSSLRTIAVAVLLVVGFVVVAVLVARAGDPATTPPNAAGSGSDVPRLDQRPPSDESFALPPATLKGFAGGPDVAMEDLRGKPAIINFWATWCAPCVKEMPEFVKAADEFGDSVAFLGVDVEDQPSNAEPFVERLGVDYPLAIDPASDFHRSVGNFGMPTTLFVDADGIVRYRHTGPLDLQELRSLTREHLGVAQ